MSPVPKSLVLSPWASEVLSFTDELRRDEIGDALKEARGFLSRKEVLKPALEAAATMSGESVPREARQSKMRSQRKPTPSPRKAGQNWKVFPASSSLQRCPPNSKLSCPSAA